MQNRNKKVGTITIELEGEVTNTIDISNKEIVNLEDFDTSNVKDMRETFMNCSALKEFDVPEVEELCPTELPLVEANELRIDNLLKFKDGTYGIIDYECQYKKAYKYKYYARQKVLSKIY